MHEDPAVMMMQAAHLIRQNTAKERQEQLLRIQMYQKQLDEINLQTSTWKEDTQKLKKRIVDVQRQANIQVAELAKSRQRVEHLQQIDGDISYNLQTQTCMGKKHRRHVALQAAADADKLLVIEEVDYAQTRIKDTSEALCDLKQGLEQAERRGMMLLDKKHQQLKEKESCEQICEEGRRVHAELQARQQKLRTGSAACARKIAELEKCNASSSRAIIGTVEEIASLGKSAMLQGLDSGHHNEKQKIRRVMQMEKENIEFRNQNMKLQAEVRRLTKVQLRAYDC